MEREEGELTDEDLEDVSDNSSMSVPIIIPGKSPSREPFRELSLTSISDDSGDSIIDETSYRQLRYDLHRRHTHKHHKDDKNSTNTKTIRRLSTRHASNQRKRSYKEFREYSSVSSSSDDDSDYIPPNKTILKQLREAVGRTKNLPNCSLRTRLKRMIEPVSQGSNSDDDDNLEALRDQALQSKLKTEQIPSPNSVKDSNETNVNDEDLTQLRMIALKSAIIKKHAERLKRKEQLKQQNDTQVTSENIPETGQNEQNKDVIDSDQSNYDKNKELKNDSNHNSKTSIEEDEDILRAMLLTSISKKISTKKTVKQINTAFNNKNTTIQSNKTNAITLPFIQKSNDKNSIKISTMPINRFIINVNSDTESDSDKNEKKQDKIVKKEDLFDKSLSLFLQQARAKTELEKSMHQSDISHLPRSQQLEYKRLKRKLQILSTRMKPVNKIKKIIGPDENTKTKINLFNNKRNVVNNKFITVNQYNNEIPSDKVYNKNEDKLHKDDRLQIKGKYEALAPLMTRVSEARNARDKAQTEVKKLINDLKVARAQLTTNHQEYTVLVQELVKAKADIDKRLDDQVTNKKSTLCTSTPNKIRENITCELSVIDKVEKTPLEINAVVVEEPKPLVSEPIKEIPIDNNIMEVVEENVPVISEKKEATILKYSSPLDHMQLNNSELPLPNPLLELCPYDLLGVCRDSDCSYQHYGNAITD